MFLGNDAVSALRRTHNSVARLIRFNSKMNNLMNTACFQFQRNANFDGYDERKKQFHVQPESLFSMALYDVDTVMNNEASSSAGIQQHAPAFYPVDEYKDLSLKEILDISDDLLFSDDDPLMTAPLHETSPLPVVPTSHIQHRNPVISAPALPPPPVMSYCAPPSPPQVEMIRSVPPNVATPITTTPSPQAAPANPKKRSRGVEEEDDEDDENRFRPYQAGQWSEKFQELLEYRERMGHCLVPHTYKENLPLARWVKRQRYQYKLMIEGKASTMTEERVKALEDIGFVWDSQGAAWEERLTELAEFRQIFQHCNVPSNYSHNPQLATWVKCQRRQYKLYSEGKPSNMTPLRVQRLLDLGFEWELRSYKKQKTC